jgi:hypothetical protein
MVEAATKKKSGSPVSNPINLKELLPAPDGNYSHLRHDDMRAPEAPSAISFNEILCANRTPSLHDLRQVANKIAHTRTPITTPFESVSERLNGTVNSPEINTSDNINTEETTQDTDSENTQPRNNYAVHEFSVSTLSRKLEAINKLKKDKKYKKDKKHKRHSHFNDKKSNKNVHSSIYRHRHNSITAIDENTPLSTIIKNDIGNDDSITIMMNPSKLINEHMSEIQLRIVGHTRAAGTYERREKIIGYPVTILSSFVSSTILMSISTDPDSDQTIIKSISLALSLISFFLSVSRDYLNYARKFQSHDLSSKLYTTLLRSVEVRLINSDLEKDEKRDIFKDIIDQMSIIEQYETPVPAYIDRQVRKDNAVMNDVSYIG